MVIDANLSKSFLIEILVIQHIRIIVFDSGLAQQLFLVHGRVKFV
jgi:hypothetical protein